MPNFKQMQKLKYGKSALKMQSTGDVKKKTKRLTFEKEESKVITKFKEEREGVIRRN